MDSHSLITYRGIRGFILDLRPQTFTNIKCLVAQLNVRYTPPLQGLDVSICVFHFNQVLEHQFTVS